ncbi:MAG: error-prone DNA polymerase [Caldilineales bacterium]|nr:error-prone DNA polymerase [Caldilineales bacterium]MDW8319330.1 error-prone DNA polymerase [Anaerolineae bacterium]
MYCELHCHSYYSLLDGASSPRALVERAAALGMPALALTDHDGLIGAVEFWRAAQAQGMRPIVGAEVTLARGTHLTLLAETQAGYANLCRLISVGHLAGAKGQPRLTIEDVARHAEGLLCLSGCRQGAVAQALIGASTSSADGASTGSADDAARLARAVRAAGRLVDIFGRDRVWIELQHHLLPDDDRLVRGLLAVARAVGVGAVATNNVHYATADGHRLHDVLTATRHGVSLAELGPRRRPNSEFYLKGAAEMAALFSERPDALDATWTIAERCAVSLDFSGRRLPAFPPRSEAFPQGLPPGETPFSYLYRLAHAGLLERYRPATPQAVSQLAHELAVIEAVGLADYFLIVWDIVREARARGIRCQGRGSAANSLVAYVLGITSVDPLAHNLLFERFLSDRTDTIPDIDLDFARDRRDEVIAYVYDRYGHDHAAMVCNVVTYQPRLALRDAARALGFPPEEVGRLVEGRSVESKSVDREAEGAMGADVGSAATSPSLALLNDIAAQLVGVPRHLSVHVGGVLITAQPLVEVVPLERAAKPNTVVAQWNKDSVEDAGLIKIDLLSLATLAMLSEACALVERRHGTAPDLDRLPLDDPAVYRLLAAGDTIGCFQVESRAQISMLPRLRPTRFEDLIVEIAIVRPGPIQGGMVHPYLRRRQGLEPVTYLHPSLEPALRETLGVVVFQEQVLRVAMALAGFTPGEADLLRRAMSRSRSAEAMAELEERFVRGALARGVEEPIARQAFHQLRGFATYGFCKSHAASFALIAYQTLWLKAHYPAEFYCALLNQQPMGFYSPEVIVGDAQRHGVAVLRPDVNASQERCTLERVASHLAAGGNRAEPVAGTGDALRLGLRYLAGLGQAGIERLLAAREDRPFDDLADFCRRTRLPRSLVADLIRAGALDSLRLPRRQLLWALGGLRYEEEALMEPPDVDADLPELSGREAMAWEYELMGLSPDGHPMQFWRAWLSGKGVLAAAELAGQPAGAVVRTAGMVVVRQAPPTAKDHLFLTLEDETGLVNLVVRPDLRQRRDGEALHRASLLLVEGRLQREGEAISLLVQRAQALRAGDAPPVAAGPRTGASGRGRT